MSTTAMVNGRSETIDAPAETILLHVLRHQLGLAGARFGCGSEKCGACMVLLDGTPAFSCTLSLDATQGRAVTTLEGIIATEAGQALLDAFLVEQAGQCGYCLSGILVSSEALIRRNPAPSRAEIVAALEPHLCRCGAHPRILKAVARAAAARRAMTAVEAVS